MRIGGFHETLISPDLAAGHSRVRGRVLAVYRYLVVRASVSAWTNVDPLVLRLSEILEVVKDVAEERGPRRTVGIDAFVKMILPFSCVCVPLWDTLNEVLMESLSAFGECSIVIDGFVLAFRLTFPFR